MDERNTARTSGAALWGVVVAGAGLYGVQSALADDEAVTARWLIALGVMLGAAGVATWLAHGEPRREATPPEPVSLVLAGLAGLSLWAVAWWAMDVANHGLLRATGALPAPASMLDLADPLLGVDLSRATYELEILFAVVLIPLAIAWLVWDRAQRELARRVGRWRAAWLAGALGGALMALATVQNVAPGLPSGLASLGGYVLIGWVAALAVYLTGSAWSGFAAHATFAYASFAVREDLALEMSGRGYLDVAWLTLIVLGVFGAVMILQAIRFRTPRPAEPPRVRGGRAAQLWLPLAVLLAAVLVMAARDVRTRRDQADEAAQVARPPVTAAAETRPAGPSGPARPARG